MGLQATIDDLAERRPWAIEVGAAVIGLALGVALMPALIFYGGSAVLGRYEGASLGGQYAVIFQGLREASVAAWVVLLGPYALYLLFRALRLGWRAGAR
jgi:hypothetical protein